MSVAQSPHYPAQWRQFWPYRAVRAIVAVIGGFLSLKIALLLVGAMLANPVHGPAPAEQAIEARQAEAVALQDQQEAERQASYAAGAGAPAPTRTWTP